MLEENSGTRKNWRALRPSILVVAVYAVLCAAWSALAFAIAPGVVVAAYHGRSVSAFNWVFRHHRSLPVEHYLDHWRAIASATLIALVMHLAILLLIAGFDRKHQSKDLGAEKRRDLENFVLAGYSAAFLAVTVITGSQGDYKAYVEEWASILQGHNPWSPISNSQNAYGPLFNVLAVSIWLTPLANKLLFAFSYLAFVIWLKKGYGPQRGLEVRSWDWIALTLLNPFPWKEIAYYGYLDVLVGVACVVAVHSFVRRKEALSGAYLALGTLLKFMPIVILPFLAVAGRRLHSRFIASCIAVVVFGLLASILLWGGSTFTPIFVAATRDSSWSIYGVLNSAHSPLRLLWSAPHSEWMEKPLLLLAGLALFAWCVLRRVEPLLASTLAILVTLLLYRSGFANYQLVFFCLVSYWSVSEWPRLRKRSILPALLFGYFSFLAIVDFDTVLGITDNVLFAQCVIFVSRFLLGSWLLIELLRFLAAAPAPTSELAKELAA